MNRNTIIRIAIPSALYESVKGKVLNEIAVEEEVQKISIDGEEFEELAQNQFLSDLNDNTFFDTKIIDELEDYLIQNKLVILKKSKSPTKEGIKDIFTKGAMKQKGKTVLPKGDKKLDMKVFDDETAKEPIYKDKAADAKKK
jgi:hypothetical protein